MNCQILFSGKNKKTITNLSSAELAQRVVKINGIHTRYSSVPTNDWKASSSNTGLAVPKSDSL